VAKLKYTLKSDVLFKLLFVKYPELLRRSSRSCWGYHTAA